ncbi:MAG TPA: trypsin-like peptidase domain-containing protein [Gemmatimonadota bacterium]|nr:trypsin-like peptidase domain-containing protein [Gemmatimonadota bacterium]
MTRDILKWLHLDDQELMNMSDAMRTKLNLMLTAVVAFGIGLAATAPFDFARESMARPSNDPLVLDVRGPMDRSPNVDVPTGFADVARQITPAVVTIEVERELDVSAMPFAVPMDEPPVAPGSGSGFIISADGYIVTNNHVVAGARSIEVLLADGRRFDDVRLVGRDPTTDVALLKLEAPDLAHATIGSSEAAQVGDWVLAIGSPGFNGPGINGRGSSLITTVTAGIISAKGRSINILRRQFSSSQPSPAIEDFIQTDAVINPGNSGGPLVNSRGEVIGVNTAIASNTGTYQGYGFAVPIDLVREVVDDLVEHGTVRRAVLGITVSDVDDADARYLGLDRVGGALVRSVADDSPAGEAELETGDVIVEVAGHEISSVSDLQRRIRTYEPGDIVTITIVDWQGERKTRRVELIAAEPVELAVADRQPDAASTSSANPLGIRVQEIDGEVRRALALPRGLNGVVISDVDQNGPFARRADPRAVRGRMIITEMNRREIESVEDYQDVLDDVEPGDVVGMMMYDAQHEQAGTPAWVPITVPVPSR